jgi:hypothetical protein
MTRLRKHIDLFCSSKSVPDIVLRFNCSLDKHGAFVEIVYVKHFYVSQVKH